MSSSKKPDLSKIKKKISGEEPEPPPPVEEPEAPRIRPETMQQMHAYAKDVEAMRKEDEEIAAEQHRVELEELPEAVKEEAAKYQAESIYYRGTPTDNPEIRAAIEEHCTGMDFSDLVLTGRVSQHVPILEDKLVVRYRSLLASENFWIERRAEGEAATDWGLRSWMGYARLVLSVDSINGNAFPPYEVKEGEIDSDAFNDRFKKVMNMGEKLVELLLIHLHWFNDRVDRLYTDDFEKLKNG